MSAYNSSELIERAIKSILDQSFSSFELIILDDGSTDDTVEKIRSFSDERIRFFQLEHSGLPTALNYGVARSESEVIIRHDSDDWSEPDRFALQMQRLDEYDELALVASWHNVVEADGNLLGLKPTAVDDVGLKQMLARRSPFCHGSVAMRKSALAEMGGYNEALLFSQDYDLWLRMAAAKMKFACIASPLYNYSVTPESIAKGWSKLSNASAIRANAIGLESMPDFAVTGAPPIGKRRTEALWYYAVGSLALENGNRRTALLSFSRSLAKDPRFWRSAARMALTLIPRVLANRLQDAAKKRLESRKVG